MDSVIRKWGDSPAVRLPTSAINQAHFMLGQKVTIAVKDGEIIIEPLQKLKYALEELVAGMTDDNQHGEVSFGPPVGKEAL